jgi:acyl carrier protein
VSGTTVDIATRIRDIIASYGQLAVDVRALTDTDDLFRAGMTSLANVTVMLGLESEFGLEFPEEMLRRSTFESISAIESAVGELLERDGAA